MTREIRIYIEGGGDGRETKARLQQGFSAFLSRLRERARDQRIRWEVERIRSEEVRSKSQYCERLFHILLAEIGPG